MRFILFRLLKKFIFLLFCFQHYTSLSQTNCTGPGARTSLLIAKGTTKDSIFLRVRDDIALISPTPSDTIADIGSYDGYYPAMYSIFSDSVTFYLNDVTVEAFNKFDSIVSLCQRLKGDTITNKFYWVVGNDSCTNLPSNLFKKVILRDALHHFRKPDKMLGDIKRIMKHDGKLFLFEPIRGVFYDNNKLCSGAMDESNLIKLMKRNGFVLIKKVPKNILYEFVFKTKN